MSSDTVTTEACNTTQDIMFLSVPKSIKIVIQKGAKIQLNYKYKHIEMPITQKFMFDIHTKIFWTRQVFIILTKVYIIFIIGNMSTRILVMFFL